MSELVAWCFHSPRRLLLVAAVVVALLVVGGAAVRQAMPPSGSDGAAPAPTVGTATVAGADGAVNAAVDFVRAWASKPASTSSGQWLAALEPLVTPDLGRRLGETDPSSLPGGSPAGPPSVRFLAQSSALIEVPLSTSAPVLVTVVQLGGHWLATDVQPLAGDDGDVAPASDAAAAGAGAGSPVG